MIIFRHIEKIQLQYNYKPAKICHGAAVTIRS